jgi:predicted phosphodiesterase
MYRKRHIVLPLLLATVLVGCRAAPSDVPLPNAKAANPHRDVTFFVAADTHVGHNGIEERNIRQIEAMNALPGTPWPAELGGTVDHPRGVVIAGDLTQHGLGSEWQSFLDHYGLRGEAKLRWPVYLLTGNHDRTLGIITPVLQAVEDHHGSLLYGWTWDGVAMLSLDDYPRAGTRDWLARQLERIGRDTPVVLFMHYSIEGPYSDWWRDRDKEAFAETIAGYNVVVIFHGHYHHSLKYRWSGVPVINVGSPRHSMHSFAAVRMTDGRMDIASWNWDRGGWQWALSLPMHRDGEPARPALAPPPARR